MRIAVNTRFLLAKGLEGIGKYSHEILSRLVALRPKDDFIFFFDRPFDPKFVYQSNVSARVLSPQARHPFLWYWWFERSVPKALKACKADIFISPDSYCSLKTDVPTALVIHDLGFEHYPDQVPKLVRKYYQKYTPLYCKKAAQLIAVSQATKKDMQEQYKVKNNIAVIPNAGPASLADLSLAEKTAIREQYASSKKYFCCLGAVHPRKKIDRTIRVFNQFKKQSGSDAQLLIIGRMAWKTSEVEQAYNNSKYKSDIHFLGFVPDAEVPRLLGASEALLFLSIFEGFGIPILEAFAAGVPVIYTNTSAMPEVAGKGGIPVSPEDDEEVVAAMHAVQEPATRQKLKTSADYQLSKYSWDRSAKLLSNLIDEMGKEL